MEAPTDWIPAQRLSLEHCVPVDGGEWVPVTGLTLDGTDVVVNTGVGASFRVPATHLVRARRSSVLADPTEERAVERQLSDWYAGDLPAAEHALHAPAEERPVTRAPRIAYGHPVPGLVRDAAMVGVFGGDLDALLDALGAQTDDDVRARLLRAAAERVRSAGRTDHEDGSPPEPVADEELTGELAAHYGGDLEAVTPPRPRNT